MMLKEMNKGLEEKRKKMRRLKEEEEGLREGNEEMRRVLKEIEDDEEIEVREMKEKIEVRRKENEEREVYLKGIRRKQNEYKEKMYLLSKEMVEMEEHCDYLDKEYAMSKIDYEELIKYRNDLGKGKDEIKREDDPLMSKRNEIEASTDEIIQSNQRISERNKELKEEIEGLSKQLNHNENEYVSLVKKNYDLNCKLMKYNNSITSYHNTINKINSDSLDIHEILIEGHNQSLSIQQDLLKQSYFITYADSILESLTKLINLRKRQLEDLNKDKCSSFDNAQLAQIDGIHNTLANDFKEALQSFNYPYDFP